MGTPAANITAELYCLELLTRKATFSKTGGFLALNGPTRQHRPAHDEGPNQPALA